MVFIRLTEAVFKTKALKFHKPLKPTYTHTRTQAGALTRLESKHGGEVSACVETIRNLKCQIPNDAVPACAGWVRFPHHLNLAHQRAHGTCRLSGKQTNPGKHHDFRLAKLKRTWHFHPNNTNNLGFDGSSMWMITECNQWWSLNIFYKTSPMSSTHLIPL